MVVVFIIIIKSSNRQIIKSSNHHHRHRHGHRRHRRHRHHHRCHRHRHRHPHHHHRRRRRHRHRHPHHHRRHRHRHRHRHHHRHRHRHCHCHRHRHRHHHHRRRRHRHRHHTFIITNMIALLDLFAPGNPVHAAAPTICFLKPRNARGRGPGMRTHRSSWDHKPFLSISSRLQPCTWPSWNLRPYSNTSHPHQQATVVESCFKPHGPCHGPGSFDIFWTLASSSVFCLEIPYKFGCIRCNVLYSSMERNIIYVSLSLSVFSLNLVAL